MEVDGTTKKNEDGTFNSFLGSTLYFWDFDGMGECLDEGGRGRKVGRGSDGEAGYGFFGAEEASQDG